MNRLRPFVWWFACLWLVACTVPSKARAEALDDTAGSRNMGTTVSVDEVTSGLVANSVSGWVKTPETATRPNAGKEIAPAPADRQLIYQGTMHVEAARPDEAIGSFLAQAKTWGGYLQSQTDQTVRVRLPAPRFDEAMSFVRGLGRVLGETRTATDVTEECVDLDLRLDNARKSRERLLALLQKADKVEDMLKVETELRRLTEEIERMEGRRKFLADQVAMATLEVAFAAAIDHGSSYRGNRFDWITRVGVESIMRGF